MLMNSHQQVDASRKLLVPPTTEILRVEVDALRAARHSLQVAPVRARLTRSARVAEELAERPPSVAPIASYHDLVTRAMNVGQIKNALTMKIISEDDLLESAKAFAGEVREKTNSVIEQYNERYRLYEIEHVSLLEQITGTVRANAPVSETSLSIRHGVPYSLLIAGAIGVGYLRIAQPSNGLTTALVFTALGIACWGVAEVLAQALQKREYDEFLYQAASKINSQRVSVEQASERLAGWKESIETEIVTKYITPRLVSIIADRINDKARRSFAHLRPSVRAVVDSGSDDPRPAPEPAGDQQRWDVFLCHASEDKQQVRDLYQRLNDRGFRTWLDEVELLPGQDWDPEIRRAIRRSLTVVTCLSKKSVEKTGFLQKELRFALDVADEHPPGVIFIIPVLLEQCDIPPRLQRWQYVSLDSAEGFSRLSAAIERRRESRTV